MVTSVSEVIVIFLQLILLANTAFCSLPRLVSRSFWEGDDCGEISTRWRYFEKTNHRRNRCL